MPEEDMPTNLVDDWLDQQDQLPARCPTFIEQRYQQLFAVDVDGVSGHDHFVFIAPNGVTVVGLAPSHALIRAHRNKGVVEQPEAVAAETEVAAQSNGEAAAPAAGGTGNGSIAAGAGELGSAAADDAAAAGAVAVEPDAVDQSAPSDKAVTNGEQAAVTADASVSVEEDEDEEADEEAGTTPTPPPAVCETADGQKGNTGSKQQQQQAEGQGQGGRKGKRKRGQEGQARLKAVPVFAPATLARVNFDVGRHGANAMTKQSGKNRSQGSQMYANSLLAKLESSNGER